MSQAARTALVGSLTFTNGIQKADLLNPAFTSTYLIEALASLRSQYAGGVLITAVRHDHATRDGLLQHAGGKAVDCYPADWQTGEHDAVIRFAEACKRVNGLHNIGLGGVAMEAWITLAPWSNGTTRFLFRDNTTDHFHLGISVLA